MWMCILNGHSPPFTRGLQREKHKRKEEEEKLGPPEIGCYFADNVGFRDATGKQNWMNIYDKAAKIGCTKFDYLQFPSVLALD